MKPLIAVLLILRAHPPSAVETSAAGRPPNIIILPTLAEFSGAELPKGKIVDGHSFVSVLRGEKEKHRDWIYSYLDDGRVLRDSRWLLEIRKDGKGEKFFDCG